MGGRLQWAVCREAGRRCGRAGCRRRHCCVGSTEEERKFSSWDALDLFCSLGAGITQLIFILCLSIAQLREERARTGQNAGLRLSLYPYWRTQENRICRAPHLLTHSFNSWVMPGAGDREEHGTVLFLGSNAKGHEV